MEVKNIDVALIDADNSVESRELISRFQNSPRFRKIFYAQNVAEFKEKIDNQKALIGLYINNDFSKNIKANRPTKVLVVVDGRQTNTAAIAGDYASQIIASYSSEISATIGATINGEVRNWHNPNLEYRWFVLTAIVSMLAMLIALLLTALSIARERELGTFDQFIVSPLSSFEILLGKSVPPLIISTILTLVMAFFVITLFKVPFTGSFCLFLITIIISLLSFIGTGLFISSIVKTQQQALLSVVIFQVPSTLLSGFISPIEDMPVFLQYFTYLNPSRFFMALTRGIFLKDMSASSVFINLIPLIVVAVITMGIASWTFKRKLD